MELYEEIECKIRQLEMSVKSLRQNGIAYAESERDYKILLREECLKLKEEGVAIGLMNFILKGIPKVAEARFKRDVAEVVYKANQEAINAIKLQIRLIDNQLGREYGGPQC